MTRRVFYLIFLLSFGNLCQANNFSYPPGQPHPLPPVKESSFQTNISPTPPLPNESLITSDKLLWIKSIQLQNLVPRAGISHEGIQWIASKKLQTLAIDTSDDGWHKIALKDLEKIVNAITQTYRLQGYVLTHAYLPEQALIEEGAELVIAIREPILSHVKTIPDKRFYKDKSLIAPWQPLLNKAVFIPDIQNAITQINYYPGMAATAIFTPGDQADQTKIELDISESKQFEATVFTDNHGSDETGRYHLGTTISYHNPTQHLDSLKAQYTQNFDPDEGGNWMLHYTIPWNAKLKTVIGAQITQNIFDLGAEFKDTGIAGSYWQTELYLKHYFTRNKQNQLALQASLIRQNSVMELDQEKIKEDDLSAIKLSGTIQKLITPWRMNSYLKLEFTRGIPHLLGSMDEYQQEKQNAPPSQGGGGHYAKGRYNRANLLASMQYYATDKSMILFQAQGQWSPNLLTSLERKSLGNAYQLRAYDSEYMVDSAIVTSLEGILFFSLSSRIDFQPKIFFEYGQGWINHPDTFELENHVDGVKMYDYGVGATINLFKDLALQMTYARPYESAKQPTDQHAYRMWFHIKQSFSL